MDSTLTPSLDHTNNGSKLQPWIVCLSAGLFFFYEFVQMSMFNAINPYLIKAFHVNAAQLGNLSAFYFYADVLFLIPAGLILDKMSPRRVILYAMSLCIVGTFAFAMSSNLYIAMAARFATGMGAAFCLLSALTLAARWFPPKKLALVSGIIVTMAMLGGVLAQTPLAHLTAAIGWREALFVNAMMGIALLTVIFFAVKDYPQNYQHPTKTKHDEQQNFWMNLWTAAKNSQNWLAGLYTSMLNLPIFLLAQTWGVMYVEQAHHIVLKTNATNITASIFVGTVIGSPFAGWLSDRIGRRKLPMIVGAIFSLATILVIMFSDNLSYPELLGLFFLLGFFTSTQIISYPLITESSRRILTASSLSIASVLIMMGGTTEPFFGWLLSLHWNGTMVNHLPFYSSANFLLAMSIFPACFIIGLICTFFIRETHCSFKG